MSIYNEKIELVYYTFIRYRAMFIFICHCTRILLNKIHSVNVKYLIDYKVKFLIYTRTYSLKGRVRGGMIFVVFFRIHCMISFRFVSQFTYFISFRFSVYIFCFVSLCFVSHFTGTLFYKCTTALVWFKVTTI
jgi:hypothetical protein